jgi:hypothetical protein
VATGPSEEAAQGGYPAGQSTRRSGSTRQPSLDVLQVQFAQRPLKSWVGRGRGELITIGAESMQPHSLEVAKVGQEVVQSHCQGRRPSHISRLAREIQHCQAEQPTSLLYEWRRFVLDNARECGFSGRLAGAMPHLQDTAYPRLKSVMTARDLSAVFTPSSDEILVARRTARGAAAQLGFLVLSKLYQRLGRPTSLAGVPHSIVEHVARAVGIPAAALVVEAYGRSGTQQRHLAAIRNYLEVRS